MLGSLTLLTHPPFSPRVTPSARVHGLLCGFYRRRYARFRKRGVPQALQKKCPELTRAPTLYLLPFAMGNSLAACLAGLMGAATSIAHRQIPAEDGFCKSFSPCSLPRISATPASRARDSPVFARTVLSDRPVLLRQFSSGRQVPHHPPPP